MHDRRYLMIRVWFNHWFSTSYRLIELMKENREEQVCVIGTNKQVNSVIRNVCDEWYNEPDTDGEEYAQIPRSGRQGNGGGLFPVGAPGGQGSYL